MQINLNNMLAIVCIVFWGLWGFFEKKGVMHGHPLIFSLVVALSVFITEVPLFSYLIMRSRTPIEINKSLVLYAVLAEICLTVATLAISFLLKNSNAGWAVSLTSVYPIITLILSYIFLGEEITVRNIMGIAFILVGMIFIN